MRRVSAMVLSVLVSLLVTSPIAAAKPLTEHLQIRDIGIHDDFLSEACGFDIWVDAIGVITFRVWLDSDDNPTREVNNFGVRVRYYSDGGSIRTQDVGADRVIYHPDGSVTLTVIGNVQSIQVPGQGRVYSSVGRVTFHFTFPDPEGEPVVEVLSDAGQHSDIDQLDVICGLLAP
jgi:hypothetical protein